MSRTDDTVPRRVIADATAGTLSVKATECVFKLTNLNDVIIGTTPSAKVTNTCDVSNAYSPETDNSNTLPRVKP